MIEKKFILDHNPTVMESISKDGSENIVVKIPKSMFLFNNKRIINVREDGFDSIDELEMILEGLKTDMITIYDKKTYNKWENSFKVIKTSEIQSDWSSIYLGKGELFVASKKETNKRIKTLIKAIEKGKSKFLSKFNNQRDCIEFINEFRDSIGLEPIETSIKVKLK